MYHNNNKKKHEYVHVNSTVDDIAMTIINWCHLLEGRYKNAVGREVDILGVSILWRLRDL